MIESKLSSLTYVLNTTPSRDSKYFYYSDSLKIGSVGPADHLIDLVSPY